MQRFLGSSFSLRRNRFNEAGSKFQPVSVDYINIGNSFNSINYEKQFFTNFVNTSNQKVFLVIKDLYSDIINNSTNSFKDYVFDEIYYKENVIDRLIDIINESNNSNYDNDDLCNIYKLKNLKYPKIHLYVKIVDGIMFILLIDLYHLSMPGDLYANHRLIKRTSLNDLIKIYNKYKDYNYNLNKIFDGNKLETIIY